MFGVGAYNVTQSGTQLALFSLASTVTAFGRVHLYPAPCALRP